VFGFPFIVLMPVVARDVLHTDARGYGLLMAAVGYRGDAGSPGLAFEGRASARARSCCKAARRSACCWSVRAVRSVGVALALLALAGCAMIVTTALPTTMLQTLVPTSCAAG